jgi:GDP-L-fucose synthase
VKILLTGAGGFLGQHVQTLLGKVDCTYHAISHRSDLDLRDPWETERFFDHWRPDVVIHLAAVVGGIGANQATPADFFIDNALMGASILSACRKTTPKRLVMVGTTCSYPKVPPRIPFREEDLFQGYPEETNAPYGVAKRSLMVGGAALQRQYGIRVVNLIPTNLYGPGDHFDPAKSHVIPALIRRFLEAQGGPVTLWGTGNASRDFLYVADAADAIVRSLDADVGPEPINLGGGREISIRELAYIVADVCGYEGEIHWDAGKPDGQPRRSLATDAAERLLGWKAATGLREGLERTVEAYQASRGAIA